MTKGDGVRIVQHLFAMKLKSIAFVGWALLTGVLLPAGAAPGGLADAPAGRTYSSLDLPFAGESIVPSGTVALAESELSAVFALYEKISGRSVIPADRLPHPRLSYRLDKALPRREVLQALDTLLSNYGVTMIVMGTNFVKAVNEAEATREAAPELSLPAELLPDSNTYIQCVVRLDHRAVNTAIPVIQPLVRLPNSVMTMPSSNSLLIRDYSANVRRVLGVIRKFDTPDDGRVFDDSTRRPKR